ncbi:hypothetical protein BZG36_02803 [Bifiguratus adelaidae]|uniref:3-beta hydroxysteroid dehydrogenase/isomerase domain-containing protein n=1 Tax=Bifiguratus adelaidae TaxID=1938954 RepID=A0A261Y1M6_9FUNG|nr:hypothetical protein BZG36_02803 [Bifiguratus adelaidae]
MDDPDVTYHIGDLRKYDDVFKALEGITAVIHTASPLASSTATAATEKLYWEVNVEGTRTVIRACQDRGISRLVVTSSGSVVSTGKPMINITEAQPYPNQAIDKYAESKMECEKLVLASNGERGLYTCTIRPSFIFGPGDRQMIPGLMEVCQRGQHRFQIGDNTALIDFTYVGNVAYAHVLAAERLVKGHEACGLAFNVTNGTPIPFWDFSSLVWLKAGYHVPKNKRWILSGSTPYIIAFFSESIYHLKAFFVDKSKLKEGITRARINHVMASRYFDLTRAKRILEYAPLVGIEDGIEISVKAYKK